jgi:type VI secretion system secreted protein VgrG
MPTLIEITSPLKNKLTLTRLVGSEKLSTPFQFTIEMQSKSANPVSAKEVIGKNMTVTLELPNNKKRYFSGIISNFGLGKINDTVAYHVTLIPSLGLLKFKKNSRIFQQKSVKKIVSQILSEHKITADFKLNSSYPDIEYCVQYHETDFDFISRLLEKSGIFYFFKHEKSSHKLIFADNTQVYEKMMTNASMLPSDTLYSQINSWVVNYAFFSGAATYNDHDFTAPDKKLLSKKNTRSPVADNTQYEIYNYPGDYKTTQAGESLSTLCVEQHESQSVVGMGKSNFATLFPCATLSFDAKQMPAEKNKTYVVTEIQHFINTDYNDALIYQNAFLSIPDKTLFRPHEGLKKPQAPSTQLATVVGPKGKEIYTDKYGRLKAQFFWDRDGKNNDKSSCWMRTTQQWDGLLRVGTPVIVGFIDDDIDKPIILGPVYNANLMPLYPLDADQTKSSIKRRYIKKDTEKTYNEMRFEDKKDKQELYLYASKDLVITVENDSTQTVKKGNYILKVKGNITIQADGAIALDSKKDITISGQNIVLNAKSKIETKAPMQNITADGVLTLKGGLIKEN